MKVLILCTGNSCRSQMAEGFLRRLAGNAASIHSAGIEAHGLNLRAVATMAQIGIDISLHKSETTDAYLNAGVTHVITVCDHAAEVCPFFPEDVKFSHFSFPDPAKATGTEDEIMAQFAAVRDEIAAAMQKWWAAH
jgi:arsenate reductase (thioredoxin)